MMLGDRSEVRLRLGRKCLTAWRREHGWRFYVRVAPDGSWLRWNGCVVPSMWQAERERGEWPPPGSDVAGWWPLPENTPTLERGLRNLNRRRRRAGLTPVKAWSKSEPPESPCTRTRSRPRSETAAVPTAPRMGSQAESAPPKSGWTSTAGSVPASSTRRPARKELIEAGLVREASASVNSVGGVVSS
jgi:hypothetical protein